MDVIKKDGMNIGKKDKKINHWRVTIRFVIHLQSERKAMVGEAKSYHKTPKTSYLEEGFSGIQNTTMVLISRDQINEVWRFPKM